VKLGIVSDSHDHVPAIQAAVRAFRDRGVETLVHAGDFVAPFAVKGFLELGVPIVAVFGNCDGEHKGVSELLPDVVAGTRRETLGGCRFVIVHSMDSLRPEDREDADVIVCGHTHKPHVGGGSPLVLNPGECCGWLSGRHTAAFFDTETTAPELLELDVP